jgi:hypothetical protein
MYRGWRIGEERSEMRKQDEKGGEEERRRIDKEEDTERENIERGERGRKGEE